MRAPRRLLLLEDNANDVTLLTTKLSAAWPHCIVVTVSNQDDFRAALNQEDLDVILSDYVVPGFDGLAALAVARKQRPTIPFLFVSGAIGDEVAVESLKAGATDYVLKDRLAKLAPAIRRALEEAEETGRRKQLEAQLRQSEEQYRALVNSVDGIVWQADLPTLRFTFVSEQAERMLGYPVERWLQEPDFWQQHIHPEDQKRAIALRSLITPKKKYESFEYRMRAADGRVVWLRDIVSVHLEPGDPLQIQGIMVNITPRKQAEAARQQIRDKLERTNSDLRRRNQEIQNFYHTLSHELKTPLTSAREFISIVMDGLAGSLNDTQSEYLSIAKESCDQLRVCINDMLDATRLETGKLAVELKPVCLTVLAQRLVATMAHKAAKKGITLHQDLQADLPEVPLDDHRITQVITNLLNNAINYTSAGGQIVLQTREAPGHPDLVQVSVSDTGYGIPKEQQDRIFDRLYQVKTGDASTEQGIGLGLYICRELVQLHGGNIWVDSEPGQGSTFSFVLPKTRELLQSNLLLIDDDPNVLNLFQHVLTAEKFNVRTARDGNEGLQEIQRRLPDIIILDLAMPCLNGPATLKEIRKNWGQVPVIVHTGFSDSDLMKEALAYSPFTLLAKPSSAEQVVETVRKVQRSDDTAMWRKNHFGLPKPILQ